MTGTHGHLNRDIMVLLLGDFLIASFCYTFVQFLQNAYFQLDQFSQTRVLIYICILILCSLAVELCLKKRSKQRNFFLRLLTASLLALTALTVFNSLIDMPRQRETIYIYSILVVYFAFQWIWHFIFTTIKVLRQNKKRVLILGSGPQAKIIGTLLNGHSNGYRLVGYIKEPELMPQVPHEHIVGAWDRLLSVIEEVKPHLLVICLKEKRGVLPLEDILESKFNGIEILDMVTFYQKITGKLLIEYTTPSWFIFSDSFKISKFKTIAQQVLNKLLAAVGLLVMLPFLPLAALLIKLDSPGPVFYRQVRIGLRGTLFVLYKLRTMVEDAESSVGAQWAVEEDPRITRVGRFLRKMRLDEVPQLYNVLKGDLSIVGPRPERPEFIARLQKVIPYYSERHCVKPGLTGWAQINYPYGASVEDALEKLRYDLYYIKNFSIFFDFQIIWKTLAVVLWGRGAR
ncbi:MAG: TIGR03013 family PEP-CTERM/XrtA system glycosyltransferase [Deltaproteobacteria bacterium]|nr:TIGR03013 family PEP-CTERM/XrtA system glycosyltransferase [Deltaproteobacteria bacterium]MBW2150034.1 TIGR03013 family PEP-CTERM/XrtA system glycosyltransferase [Deltaproteobacteria bacterium]